MVKNKKIWNVITAFGKRLGFMKICFIVGIVSIYLPVMNSAAMAALPTTINRCPITNADVQALFTSTGYTIPFLPGRAQPTAVALFKTNVAKELEALGFDVTKSYTQDPNNVLDLFVEWANDSQFSQNPEKSFKLKSAIYNINYLKTIMINPSYMINMHYLNDARKISNFNTMLFTVYLMLPPYEKSKSNSLKQDDFMTATFVQLAPQTLADLAIPRFHLYKNENFYPNLSSNDMINYRLGMDSLRNSINVIDLQIVDCPATPPPTKSFGLPVSCAPLSDDEINKLIKSFNLGTFNSTTMSPDARLAFAKKIQDRLNHYSDPAWRTGDGLLLAGGMLSGFYTQLAAPLAREISGTANEQDHKLIRLASAQVILVLEPSSVLLGQQQIEFGSEVRPDHFLDLYKDIGTPQYGDTLKSYLNSLGIPEAQSQPLIDQIKTIKFDRNCPPTMTSIPPTFPDQVVPCGPVTKAEMQTIFPDHIITLQPPAKSPAEIANFKSQLNTMFNAKDNVKPEDTQFYQNVMLWANNQLTPARHQLLRYTIEQLKILLGTYALETFNFKSESEKFAPEIEISSTKYWGEFYGHTLSNTTPKETDRLAHALMYMNNRLSSPLDPKNKMGPDAQAAVLTIIGKLQALKLAPGCPTTFAAPAPKPTVTPPAPKPVSPKPTVTPPAPKPAPKPAVTPPASAACPALPRADIFRALGTTIAATNPPKVGSPESAYVAFDKRVNQSYNRNTSYGGTTGYNLLKKAARGTPLTPSENKALSQRLRRCL